MEIYIVDQIIEADDQSEVEDNKLTMIKMSSEKEKKEFRLPKEVLERSGIREGKKVIFTPEGNLLKYIRVVAAVIMDHSGKEKKIFATARGYGDYKGWWEFPGGKIEKGETPQEALVREIREELTAQIVVGDLIKTIEYDYPDFHLSMDCFWAEVQSGQLILKEAEAARWLTCDELDEVHWLPADLELIEEIKEGIDGQ